MCGMLELDRSCRAAKALGMGIGLNDDSLDVYEWVKCFAWYRSLDDRQTLQESLPCPPVLLWIGSSRGGNPCILM